MDKIPNKKKDIFFQVSHLARLLNRIGKKDLILNKLDITMEQGFVLMELGHTDGLSQQELAKASHKDKPSITRLINNMIKRNLVIREADPRDRRINRIFITGKGKKIQKGLIHSGKRMQAELIKRIDKEKIDTWLEVMKTFSEECHKKEKTLTRKLKDNSR